MWISKREHDRLMEEANAANEEAHALLAQRDHWHRAWQQAEDEFDRVSAQRDKLDRIVEELRRKLDALRAVAPTKAAVPLAPQPAAPRDIATTRPIPVWEREFTERHPDTVIPCDPSAPEPTFASLAAPATAVEVRREVAARPRPCACGAPYGIACYCEQGKPVAG